MNVQSSTGFLQNAELAAGVRRRGNGEVKKKDRNEGEIVTSSWTPCHELQSVTTTAQRRMTNGELISFRPPNKCAVNL